MNVLWLGLEDTGGCVLHWNDLRTALSDEYGVWLAGPGYGPGEWPTSLSDLLGEVGTPDWIVMDDCNAKGYVPLKWDCVPDCKIAVREHDYWNRHRRGLHERLEPDLIMGCYDRPDTPKNWTLVPHPVSTHRFHPGDGDRPYSVGFFGKTGKMYEHRTAARNVIKDLPDVWIGQHGGYWHVKECNDGVHTFYNDLLADKLRQCRLSWVDSPDGKGGCVMKYFESAACGCVLFGEVPYNAEAYFPEGTIVPCEPDEIEDVVAWADEGFYDELPPMAWDHIQKNHTPSARAAEIVGLLEERR